MGGLQSSLVRSVGLQYPTLQNLTGDAAGSLRWLSNTASRSFDGYSPLGAITCVVDSTTLNCAVVLDTGQMARPFSTPLPTLAQGGQQHVLGNLVLSAVGETEAAGDGSSILVDTLCCVTHTQVSIGKTHLTCLSIAISSPSSLSGLNSSSIVDTTSVAFGAPSLVPSASLGWAGPSDTFSLTSPYFAIEPLGPTGLAVACVSATGGGQGVAATGQPGGRCCVAEVERATKVGGVLSAGATSFRAVSVTVFASGAADSTERSPLSLFSLQRSPNDKLLCNPVSSAVANANDEFAVDAMACRQVQFDPSSSSEAFAFGPPVEYSFGHISFSASLPLKPNVISGNEVQPNVLMLCVAGAMNTCPEFLPGCKCGDASDSKVSQVQNSVSENCYAGPNTCPFNSTKIDGSSRACSANLDDHASLQCTKLKLGVRGALDTEVSSSHVTVLQSFRKVVQIDLAQVHFDEKRGGDKSYVCYNALGLHLGCDILNVDSPQPLIRTYDPGLAVAFTATYTEVNVFPGTRGFSTVQMPGPQSSGMGSVLICGVEADDRHVGVYEGGLELAWHTGIAGAYSRTYSGDGPQLRLDSPDLWQPGRRFPSSDDRPLRWKCSHIYKTCFGGSICPTGTTCVQNEHSPICLPSGLQAAAIVPASDPSSTAPPAGLCEGAGLPAVSAPLVATSTDAGSWDWLVVCLPQTRGSLPLEQALESIVVVKGGTTSVACSSLVFGQQATPRAPLQVSCRLPPGHGSLHKLQVTIKHRLVDRFAQGQVTCTYTPFFLGASECDESSGWTKGFNVVLGHINAVLTVYEQTIPRSFPEGLSISKTFGFDGFEYFERLISAVLESVNVNLSISYPPIEVVNASLRLQGQPASKGSNRVFSPFSEPFLVTFQTRNADPLNEIRILYGESLKGDTTQETLEECRVDRTLSSENEVTCLIGTVPNTGKEISLQVRDFYTQQLQTPFAILGPEIGFPEVVDIQVSAGSRCRRNPLNTGAAFLTDCPTEGSTGGKELLTITGINFNTVLSEISTTRVFIGGRVCGVTFVSFDPQYVVCTLPRSTGLQQTLFVKAPRGFSQPVPLISYQLPIVTALCGCSIGTSECQIDESGQPVDAVTRVRGCNREGAQELRVFGEGFGYQGAKISIGGVLCAETVHSPDAPHTSLVCLGLPEGTAVNQPVVVFQSNGPSSLETSGEAVALSYTQCSPGLYQDGTALACGSCPSGKLSRQPGQTACDDCDPGTFSPQSEARGCLGCQPGFEQPLAGQATCTECKAGSYSPGGLPACLPCAQGTSAPLPAQLECALCAAGRFQSQTGGMECAPCQPGEAQVQRGGTACDRCTVGRYSGTEAAKTCAACEKGKFSDRLGGSSCEDCSAGFKADEEGQTECTACPKNEASGVGSAECSVCPTNSAPSPLATSCQCFAGFFHLPILGTPSTSVSSAQYLLSPDCIPCTAGMVCKEQELRWLAIPTAPGYWADEANPLFLPMVARGNAFNATSLATQDQATNAVAATFAFSFTAKELGIVFQPCRSAAFCLGGIERGASSCSLHRRGPLCELCTVGFRPSFLRQDANCVQCPDQPSGALLKASLLALLVLAVFLLSAMWVVRAGKSLLPWIDERNNPKSLADSGSLDHSASRTDASSSSLASTLSGASSAQLPWYSRMMNLQVLHGASEGKRHSVQRLQRLSLKNAEELNDFQGAQVNKDTSSAAIDNMDSELLMHYSSQKLILTSEHRMASFSSFPVKNIFTTLQILARLPSLGTIPLPSAVSDLLTLLDFLTLEFLPWNDVRCVTSISPYLKTALYCAIPPAFMLLSTVPLGLARCFDAQDNQDDDRDRIKRRNFILSLQRTFTYLLFVAYAPISRQILSLFSCVKILGGPPDYQDQLFLSDDFGYACLDDNWFGFFPATLSFVLVYPIGVPLGLFCLLRTYRKQGKLRHPRMRYTVGMLYDYYEEALWFWELFDMLHKLLIVSVVGLLPFDTMITVALAITGGYAGLQFYCKPYARSWDNQFHIITQIEIVLVLLSMRVLEVEAPLEPGSTADTLLSILLVALLLVCLLAFAVRLMQGCWRARRNMIRRRGFKKSSKRSSFQSVDGESGAGPVQHPKRASNAFQGFTETLPNDEEGPQAEEEPPTPVGP